MNFKNENEFLSAELSANNILSEEEYDMSCEEMCSVMNNILEENGGEILTPERIERIVKAVRMMSEDGFGSRRGALDEIETDIPFDLVMSEEIDFEF